MGLFLRQFGALFWKNWLCRVRQPILSFSELLWPCALFLILAVIRSQEPPIHVENCYLEPRNLPSHGIYPFIQSLICNAGSRCRDIKFVSEAQNSSWNLADDLLAIDFGFLKDVQELSQDILNTTEQMVSLHQMWKEVFNFKNTSDTGYLIEKFNIIENILQEIEKTQEQTFLWNLLILPWVHRSVTKHNVPVDIIQFMDEFLKIAQRFTSRDGLDMSYSTTANPITGIKDFNEALQLFQRFLSQDLKYAIHFWKLFGEFLLDLESIEDLEKQQTEKYPHFSSWHEILNIRDYIQTLVPFGMGLNISQSKKNFSVNREFINEKFELFNIVKHLQRNGIKNIVKLDEEIFSEIFHRLQEADLHLQPINWHWIETVLQLYKTIIKHVIELLKLRKASTIYLQTIAPFLKNASVDQTRIIRIVNKITEIFLNLNFSSCENIFELLQINFQLQEDISITKDITLLICSYFESFYLPNIIDDSEEILESASDFLCEEIHPSILPKKPISHWMQLSNSALPIYK